MVEALGWSEYVGEEVEVALAAAVYVRAHRLLIPAISVQGLEADNVKGVMLKASRLGVDGSLGLSYLHRFDFKIEGGKPPSLVLKVKGSSKDQGDFDVFICFKSEDQSAARTVFDFLRAEGYRPFFSPVSLTCSGEAAFQQGIDRALELARHMVVVGSSRKNMEAPWVRGEWSRFNVLLKTGRKRGNVVSVLFGQMQLTDLPIALCEYEAFLANTSDWRDKLLRYLPGHTE